MQFNQLFRSIFFILSLAGILIMASCHNGKYRNPEPDKNASWVDAFLLSNEKGISFPTACVPFGMVQVNPVYDTLADNFGKLHGFSHLNAFSDSCQSFGEVLIMPTIHPLADFPSTRNGNYLSHFSARFRHSDEEAYPGYYSVIFSDQLIRAEMSATQRTAVHRFTFPKDKLASILLDFIPANPDADDAKVFIHQESSNIVYGFQESTLGGKKRKIYFVALFSKPFRTFNLVRDGKVDLYAMEGEGKNLVAAIGYDTRYDNGLTVKIGFSTAGIEGARGNIDQETRGWFLSRVKSSAMFEWESQLRKIKIEADDNQRQIFYSALYCSMLRPNILTDRYGEYSLDGQQIEKLKGFDYYGGVNENQLNSSDIVLQSFINPGRIAEWGLDLFESNSGTFGEPHFTENKNGILSASQVHLLNPIIISEFHLTVTDSTKNRFFEFVQACLPYSKENSSDTFPTFYRNSSKGSLIEPEHLTQLKKVSDEIPSFISGKKKELPEYIFEGNDILNLTFQDPSQSGVLVKSWTELFNYLTNNCLIKPDQFRSLSSSYVLMAAGITASVQFPVEIRFFSPAYTNLVIAPFGNSQIKIIRSENNPFDMQAVFPEAIKMTANKTVYYNDILNSDGFQVRF